MHGRIRLISLLILLVIPLAALAQQGESPRSSGGEVSIQNDAVVGAERILLRHIARIEGFSAPERERIGAIYIAYAPQPGESLQIPGERVRSLIASYSPDIRVEGPETVRVTRGHALISKEQLRDMFVAAVIRQTGLSSERVKVPAISPDEDIRIPDGDSRVNLEFSPGETFRRRATARLTITVNRRPWKSLFITGNIELYGPAVKVSRAIKRGERIEAGDLIVEDVNLAQQPDSLITNPRDVLGMEALTALKAGQVLTETQVQAPVLVNRGDMVTLVVRMPNMTVTARGVAQQAGRRKQAIKVLNIASNKVVYGQVLSAREVQIAY